MGMTGMGGAVLRTGWEQLARPGVSEARTTGEVVGEGVRRARDELVRVELGAHPVGLLQEGELEAGLDGLSEVALSLGRARLRLACDVAVRGLYLGTGFGLGDWLALRCPDLGASEVRDLARVAFAVKDPAYEPLVDAAVRGVFSIARAAAFHRALVRIRGAVGVEEFARAVALLVAAGAQPVFDERDIARIVAALLRACLPEKKHDERAKAKHALRDVHESNLADGTVKRIIMTFGDDADYEAVRAVLLSPLAAPASRETQEATGVVDTRTPGNRRYDALMTVLRRGVAGSAGQPTTPKATLIVTMDLQTLRRETAAAHAEGSPGAGQTVEGTTVCAATVRQLACEADVIPLVLGGPSEVVDQGRRRRLVTPGQRLRLAARDTGCTIPGCGVPATWCDAHHVIPWAQGGRSDLSNYALLCPRHHTWVHEHGHTARVTPLGVVWLLRP
ncbi:HNH endonuclease signature motif containing protein [Ornithinimicrobium tianjinense]|uniref:HNH nuclease domain-containing protein n=1 Tax=Ornithinimicrobium tianjinense TaxID=1195761 RepID=A0A917F239_9MICO|nr:HNH endonuclease signature motif containing protein [Ornithinimicrobium tianjinense]GGF40816.1 hypothetical protein GCM10011366_05610 [Ornithinimicrobium tianjinense]